MKPHILPCILAVFLLIEAISINAQFAPTSVRINTPYGPRTITTYRHSPMMYYREIYANSNLKYKFTVVLSDDSTFTDKGKMSVSDSIHSITFREKGNKTTITPSETKGVYRTTPEGIKLHGIPTDTCWFFRTESGKINFYSCFPELGTEFVTAIQLGDNGTIEAISKARVIELLKKYPRLVELAEKQKLVKALRKYNKMD